MEGRKERIMKALLKTFPKILPSLLSTALLLLSAVAVAQTTQRPIDDFISTQGTYCVPDGGGGCVIFVPGIANFVGWGDSKSLGSDHLIVASVDYAGLANRSIEARSPGFTLGTTFSGTVVERALPDGRAAVTVVLLTENALTFAAEDDFVTGKLLFGSRAVEVLAGAQPALGDSQFRIAFTNTAPGAPLPDLVQLLFAPAPGQELKNYSFSAEAHLGKTAVTVVQTGNAARTNIQAAIVNIR
jgi:hypothetical protein